MTKTDEKKLPLLSPFEAATNFPLQFSIFLPLLSCGRILDPAHCLVENAVAWLARVRLCPSQSQFARPSQVKNASKICVQFSVYWALRQQVGCFLPIHPLKFQCHSYPIEIPIEHHCNCKHANDQHRMY